MEEKTVFEKIIDRELPADVGEHGQALGVLSSGFFSSARAS